MLSDPLQTIDRLPAKTIFLVAAALVFACQLIAMVLVADGQVEKARFRQASQVNFQSAVAACVEHSRGAELKKCAYVMPADSLPLRTDSTLPTHESDPQGLMLVRLADQH